MLAILGAGGHGRVIADAYRRKYKFYDDQLKNYPSTEKFTEEYFIVGIGDNRKRKEVFERATQSGIGACVAHESSIISSKIFATLGIFINAGAVINQGVIIKHNVIINTGAQVDHDCIVHDHAHIAPGAVLCGGVEVGEGALIGTNATILPNQKVPEWSTVKAGSLYYENPHEQPGHKQS